jgi:hypothetical protein
MLRRCKAVPKETAGAYRTAGYCAELRRRRGITRLDRSFRGSALGRVRFAPCTASVLSYTNGNAVSKLPTRAVLGRRLLKLEERAIG